MQQNANHTDALVAWLQLTVLSTYVASSVATPADIVLAHDTHGYVEIVIDMESAPVNTGLQTAAPNIALDSLLGLQQRVQDLYIAHEVVTTEAPGDFSLLDGDDDDDDDFDEFELSEWEVCCSGSKLLDCLWYERCCRSLVLWCVCQNVCFAGT